MLAQFKVEVGLVLGIEMSRLARSCRDWYQLLEVCGLFGTLIGDWEGIYDLGDYNDRLLLGLKGTMSEAELYLIKQRMLAGKRAKADRGELGMALPRGYVRQPSGEVAKDPDEQVQTTILLIFDEFERLGSLNGVLQYLIEWVIVTVRGESERVDIQIHWKGGHATAATIIRPVARLDQLSYYPQLAARVVTLHGQGHTNAAIAQMLNDEGWRPAKRCQRFNAAMVNEMRVRLGLRTRQYTPASTVHRLANEWTLAELAHQLDMPLPTLYNWLRRGQFKARKVMSQSHRLWLVQTTEEDLQRLRALRTKKPDRAFPIPSNQS